MLPRRALHRIALTGGIVALNLVLIFTIGVTRPDETTSPERPKPVTSVRRTPVQPSPYVSVPPRGPDAPADDPKASDQAALAGWARRMAAATGIPVPALTAYGRAQMWMRYEYPGCHISWTSLAAIGSLTSRAAQAGDSPLDVARELCRQGTDMRRPRGWWTAVVGYRQSVEFAQRVFGLARRYARSAS